MGITQLPSPQPISVAQGNIEYVERFTYLGSLISRDGNVEVDTNTRLAKAAAVFRRLDNVWRSSTLSLKIKTRSLYLPHRLYSHIRQWDLEEHSKNTPAAGRLPPTQPAEDFGHYVEGPHDKSRGAKPDRAAKITGHCSRETTSNGRPHHQDATWMTSQSHHVMDPSL